MGETTDDPRDPRLGRGVDDEPIEQHEVYLVLSEEERAKGFVRPYRESYYHVNCPAQAGPRFAQTKMGVALSETYARDPSFYGATYCVHCRQHRPLSEFRWTADDKVVGS